MAIANNYFLQQKKWRQEFTEEEKIMTLFVEACMKGELKLVKHVADEVENGSKTKQEGKKEKKKSKKKRSKKDTKKQKKMRH